LINGGKFAALLGPFFGYDAIAGMGLIIVMGGVIAIINGIAGYLIKPIREIESILPSFGTDITEEDACLPQD